MPEHTPAEIAAATLSTFARQYLATALWSSHITYGVAEEDLTPEQAEDERRPMDDKYTLSDLAAETIAAAVTDCATFRENARAAGVDVDAWDDSQAGHDFWLTRNGHGAGFWDGDWPEPDASILTRLSKQAGEVNLYVGDDGRIYS